MNNKQTPKISKNVAQNNSLTSKRSITNKEMQIIIDIDEIRDKSQENTIINDIGRDSINVNTNNQLNIEEFNTDETAKILKEMDFKKNYEVQKSDHRKTLYHHSRNISKLKNDQNELHNDNLNNSFDIIQERVEESFNFSKKLIKTNKLSKESLLFESKKMIDDQKNSNKFIFSQDCLRTDNIYLKNNSSKENKSSLKIHSNSSDKNILNQNLRKNDYDPISERFNKREINLNHSKSNKKKSSIENKILENEKSQKDNLNQFKESKKNILNKKTIKDGNSLLNSDGSSDLFNPKENLIYNLEETYQKNESSKNNSNEDIIFNFSKKKIDIQQNFYSEQSIENNKSLKKLTNEDNIIHQLNSELEFFEQKNNTDNNDMSLDGMVSSKFLSKFSNKLKESKISIMSNDKDESDFFDKKFKKSNQNILYEDNDLSNNNNKKSYSMNHVKIIVNEIDSENPSCKIISNKNILDKNISQQIISSSSDIIKKSFDELNINSKKSMDFFFEVKNLPGRRNIPIIFEMSSKSDNETSKKTIRLSSKDKKSETFYQVQELQQKIELLERDMKKIKETNQSQKTQIKKQKKKILDLENTENNKNKQIPQPIIKNNNISSLLKTQFKNLQTNLRNSLSEQKKIISNNLSFSFLEQSNKKTIDKYFNLNNLVIQKEKEILNHINDKNIIVKDKNKINQDKKNLEDTVQVMKSKTNKLQKDNDDYNEKNKKLENIIADLTYQMNNLELKLNRKNRKYAKQIKKVKKCPNCSQRSLSKRFSNKLIVSGKEQYINKNNINCHDSNESSDTDSDTEEVNKNDYNKIKKEMEKYRGKYMEFQSKYINSQEKLHHYISKYRSIVKNNTSK